MRVRTWSVLASVLVVVLASCGPSQAHQQQAADLEVALRGRPGVAEVTATANRAANERSIEIDLKLTSTATEAELATLLDDWPDLVADADWWPDLRIHLPESSTTVRLGTSAGDIVFDVDVPNTEVAARAFHFAEQLPEIEATFGGQSTIWVTPSSPEQFDGAVLSIGADPTMSAWQDWDLQWEDWEGDVDRFPDFQLELHTWSGLDQDIASAWQDLHDSLQVDGFALRRLRFNFNREQHTETNISLTPDDASADRPTPATHPELWEMMQGQIATLTGTPHPVGRYEVSVGQPLVIWPEWDSHSVDETEWQQLVQDELD